MRVFTLPALSFALASAALASSALAADTQPAGPKETVVALLKSLTAGDLDAALKLVATETPQQRDSAEYYFHFLLTTIYVENATMEKFGKDAFIDKHDGPALVKEIKRAETGKATIDGDTAGFFFGRDAVRRLSWRQLRPDPTFAQMAWVREVR